MKQLLVLSGKGGTGKTTVSSALIELSKSKGFADCDVEAPNLHLLFANGEKTSQDYYGMDKAWIDPDQCRNCGLCMKYCKYHAITKEDTYTINPYMCEGCAVCTLVCPKDAIKMVPSIDGEMNLYENNYIFSTAELKMGSGNSGKLVTEVRNNLKNKITDEPLVIIDGPPGIGCPVIASFSGVDWALIVAEPSLSGISDMERMIQTANGFKVKVAIIVNKFNTNEQLTNQIEEYAQNNNLPFLGKIPYDKKVVEIINQGKSVLSEEFIVSDAIKNIYTSLTQLIFE